MPTADQLQEVYADLESQLGEEKEWREVTVAFAGAGAALAARGWSAIGRLVQEAPVRVLGLLAAAVAALAVLVAPSAAGSRRVPRPSVCIPVAGPWVVIPRAPAPMIAYPRRPWRMKCPEGSIVAGVDARLAHRAVDMSFSGLLGSPVNPGVTTTDEVVFTGTYTGDAWRPTGFRPFIGCVPAAGGGRIPTAVKPGSPERNAPCAHRLVQDDRRATLSGSRGERLISSTARRRPALATRAGHRPTRRRPLRSSVSEGGRLAARATMSGAARPLPAKLQIHRRLYAGPEQP